MAAHGRAGERSRTLALRLVVTAQVHHIGQAQTQQLVDVTWRQGLQVVRTQQPTGNDLAAVHRRQPADVTEIG